jgi:hypothetical protein
LQVWAPYFGSQEVLPGADPDAQRGEELVKSGL